MSEMTVFSYLNLINQGVKEPIEVDDKIYDQFLINRGLSQHIDTIAIANLVNQYSGMSNQMHFDLLRHLVPPRKRWGKWPKPVKHPEAATISQYYGISMKKAYDLIGIITPEMIDQMREELKTE